MILPYPERFPLAQLPTPLHRMERLGAALGIELWTKRDQGAYAKKVYVLPKHLDEKVARLHLAKIGVKLTTLTPAQADYIGVKSDGPYKADQYRY